MIINIFIYVIISTVIKESKDSLINFPYKVVEENEFVFLYTSIVDKFRNLQEISIQTIFNGTDIIEFSYDPRKKQISIEIRTCDITDYPVTGLYKLINNEIHETGFRARLGCFNIVDPATLYKKKFFSDCERINV